MSSVIQGPWKKESSKSFGQARLSQRSYKKETKTSLDVDADADSHEDSPGQLGDDDDDDESDEDLIPPDPEKTKLAAITEAHRAIRELCTKPKGSGSKNTRPDFKKGGQALDDFKVQYKDVVNASGEDKKTLLHHLAKRMTKSLLSLLRWLLKDYPDLILEVDSEDHTALYTAIASQNASFVEEVCEHSKNKVEALQQTGIDGTCLHKALELGNSIPSIMRVVDPMMRVLKNDQDIQRQGDGKGNSPLRNILCKRDKEGNTPLHIGLTTIAGYSTRRDNSPSVTSSETTLDPLVALLIRLIKKHPEIMYERNKENKSPYDCLGPAKETEACAKLREEMKKGIMRNLGHEEVINLLYADSGGGMCFVPRCPLLEVANNLTNVSQSSVSFLT